MSQQEQIQLFESQQVRTIWVDEGFESVTNCNQLKLRAADGKWVI